MHYFAILKNKNVINLIQVDDNYLHQLDDMLYSLNGDEYIEYTYEDKNLPLIGGDYYNGKFRPSNPGDGFYWNEDAEMWLTEEDDAEAIIWGNKNPYDPSKLDLRQA